MQIGNQCCKNALRAMPIQVLYFLHLDAICTLLSISINCHIWRSKRDIFLFRGKGNNFENKPNIFSCRITVLSSNLHTCTVWKKNSDLEFLTTGLKPLNWFHYFWDVLYLYGTKIFDISIGRPPFMATLTLLVESFPVHSNRKLFWPVTIFVSYFIIFCWLWLYR